MHLPASAPAARRPSPGSPLRIRRVLSSAPPAHWLPVTELTRRHRHTRATPANPPFSHPCCRSPPAPHPAGAHPSRGPPSRWPGLTTDGMPRSLPCPGPCGAAEAFVCDRQAAPGQVLRPVPPQPALPQGPSRQSPRMDTGAKRGVGQLQPRPALLRVLLTLPLGTGDKRRLRAKTWNQRRLPGTAGQHSCDGFGDQTAPSHAGLCGGPIISQTGQRIPNCSWH